MKKLIAVAISVMLTVSIGQAAVAKSVYDSKNFPAQVKITGSAVNIRSAPGTWGLKVGTAYKGNLLDCKGKINGWFVVHLSNDVVGLVSPSYAAAYYPPGSGTPSTPQAPSTPNNNSAGLTADEQQMLNLVNQERAKQGLQALKIDTTVLKTARAKSQDMVNKGYFDHQSPTYGSPFDQMKGAGVTYRTAGENIAANSSVQGAHTSLMNSPGHRANILKAEYTHVGIGIVSSPKYGKMFTQQFIGK